MPDTMMATITHAPTGVNRRECLFTVVKKKAVMEKIATETINGIRKKADTETLPKGFEFFAGIVRAWDKGKDVFFRRLDVGA